MKMKNHPNFIRFLITMSRRDSPRTRSFCKDLSYALPSAIKVNRGKKSINDVHMLALQSKCDRVIIVNTFMGNPGLLTFYSVGRDHLNPLNPRLRLLGVKLTFEIRGAKKVRVNDIIVHCSNDNALEAANYLSSLFNCRLYLSKENDYGKLSEDFSIINVEHLEKDIFVIHFTSASGHIIGPVMKVKFI